MASQRRVIDTHIHLFPSSEIDQLAWQQPGGVLYSQHSVTEYKRATQRAVDIASSVRSTSAARATNPEKVKGRPELRGFVFVETDRTSGLEPTQWEQALNEIRFLARIALGRPRAGEGHDENDADLCLGIVPWAPVPAGAQVLSKYREQALHAAEEAKGLVKGWRYLVQDKARGVMLTDLFIQGLRAIAEWGEVFELGVDCRQRGLEQLQEAVECITKVNEGVPAERQLKIVINHMCKPNMQNSVVDPVWTELISQFAAFPTTFMKLSGGFSEIASLPQDPQDTEENNKARDIAFKEAVNVIHTHMNVAWKAFGSNRCMYGSDWPVCNVGIAERGHENLGAWAIWMDVVEQWIEKIQLDDQEKQKFYGGIAANVYNVE